MITFQIDDELSMRQFRDGDAESVFNIVRQNYDHLTEYMHWMVSDYSLQSAREFVERSVKAAAEGESLGFGIFRNDDLIGTIGFVKFDKDSSRTEIGYWISRTEEGKGIITRSCRLLIDHAFVNLNLNRIEIRCSVDNTRSAAVPERLGFTKEGVLRQSEMRHGKLHDFVVYGLLAGEWRSDQ
jgi:ribosomal-protein-serine acetyltransferase